jgi:hypothetical protein
MLGSSISTTTITTAKATKTTTINQTTTTTITITTYSEIPGCSCWNVQPKYPGY